MKIIENYDSVSDIKSVLRENGFNMSKRFGQNFLVSSNAREKIINLINGSSDSTVWEIGPGLGAMTHMIIDKYKFLTVFEIDYGFIRYLEEAFGSRSDFKIVTGDFVKTWKAEAEKEGVPDYILGNLPYSSASAIISTLIENNTIPKGLIVTVQKEMAQRMTASPGSKNYSSFSMLCQYAFKIRSAGDLKSGSFYPPPEVTSTIVELIPHNLYPGENPELYFKVIRDLFQSRRKKIKNNLSRGWTGSNYDWKDVENCLKLAGIDPGERGENLPVSSVVNFVRKLEHL